MGKMGILGRFSAKMSLRMGSVHKNTGDISQGIVDTCDAEIGL